MRDSFDEGNEFRGKRDSDPHPDEIALRAAEIRATWSTDVEQKRKGIQIPKILLGKQRTRPVQRLREEFGADPPQVIDSPKADYRSN